MAVVKKARWQGLGSRLLTAVIVVVICILPFYIGGYVWAVLVALFSSRMMFEWIRMTDPKAGTITLSISIAGLFFALVYAAQGFVVGAMVAMLVTVVVALVERINRDGLLWTLTGVPYIILPAIFIVLLRGGEIGFATRGFSQLIFVILVVIAADVGAYFGGSTLQGPKLAPTLSPNKTWSGAISGLIFACILSVIIGMFIGLTPWVSAMLAVPIVIVSVLGDLLESSVKRKLGVKDTGTLLPGHGGLLDRLDSLMAAVVAGAILFALLGDRWPIG